MYKEIGHMNPLDYKESGLKWWMGLNTQINTYSAEEINCGKIIQKLETPVFKKTSVEEFLAWHFGTKQLVIKVSKVSEKAYSKQKLLATLIYNLRPVFK